MNCLIILIINIKDQSINIILLIYQLSKKRTENNSIDAPKVGQESWA
jgi:hypothetical protein